MVIHANSVASIRVLKVGGRHNRILQIFHIHESKTGHSAALTDRQVKELGGFQDLNEARPRITELLSEEYGGRLIEIGSIPDPTTHKMVRVTRLAKEHEMPQPRWF